MKFLLAVRDALSRFYGTYDTYIRLFFKFLLALCSFAAINAALGQMAVLNNPLLVFGLAVVCAFLPSNSIVLVGAAMILAHFYGLSAEAAMVGGGILLIGIMLYFGIAPHSSIPLVLTALSMAAGVPCAVAVVFGLIGGPLSAIGTIFGTLGYYLITIVKVNGGNLQATATEAAEAMVQKMSMLIDAVIHNQEMLLVMAALAITLWIVWLVHRMAVKYAWMLAAVLGCLAYLVIRVAGSTILNVEINIPGLIIDIAAALACAWISQTMLFSLDYKRTQNVRFEDDEYFYYVKAVPKRKLRKRKRGRRADRR